MSTFNASSCVVVEGCDDLRSVRVEATAVTISVVYYLLTVAFALATSSRAPASSCIQWARGQGSGRENEWALG